MKKIIAINPPKDNARKGVIKNHSQVLNPKTDLWTKRNFDTGQFMAVKVSSNKLFKGVRKERK